MQWKTNGNWVIFSEINRIIEKSPFIIDYIQIDDQINIKNLYHPPTEPMILKHKQKPQPHSPPHQQFPARPATIKLTHIHNIMSDTQNSHVFSTPYFFIPQYTWPGSNAHAESAFAEVHFVNLEFRNRRSLHRSLRKPKLDTARYCSRLRFRNIAHANYNANDIIMPGPVCREGSFGVIVVFFSPSVIVFCFVFRVLLSSKRGLKYYNIIFLYL